MITKSATRVVLTERARFAPGRSYADSPYSDIRAVVGEGGGAELRLDRSGVPVAVLVGDRRGDGSSAVRKNCTTTSWGSVLRPLSGFLMSVALIVPLGLGAGWCARLGNLLNQFTEICQNTASLAVMPVFILFLDIGELSRSRCDIYIERAAPGRSCSTRSRR